MEQNYETVIGLEVHVELSTKSKIFCACSTRFGAAPNTQTCPVCTGMPGTLPVLNRQVVEYALAVGLAANCKINQESSFDRKNYFYPDNPQNYQISQLYVPICHDGWIEIETPEGMKKIGIHEIHMEEDAGKLIHDEENQISYIDYNRSGVPLLEIVSEPDMRNAGEVISYLENLRMLLQYLGVSDCKLQEGSMRVDVNLSVRKQGSAELGTRTEMKNLNSFKAIRRAITAEGMRQINLLENGKSVRQETRRWDDGKGCSFSMRSKEDAQDYRYFPEPDLVPLRIDDAWLWRVRASGPELRPEKMKRYQAEFGLSAYDAQILTSSKGMADFFEKTTALCGMPKKAANWLMTEALRLQREQKPGSEELPFSPENLAKLILLQEKGSITGTVAKEVFAKIFSEDLDPIHYVEENGLASINDEAAIRRMVENVVTDFPQSVEDYRNGKKKAIGFLVGQTMKAMHGKADPAIVNKILKEILESSSLL